MPFYVIAYEEPHYFYTIVEANDRCDAVSKAAASIIESHETLQETIGDFERSRDYESGPWSTKDRAEQALDQGDYGESDMEDE